MRNGLKLRILLLVLVGFCQPVFAVIFYSTGDVSHNTTAPTGSLDGSGWQFQGRFNQFLGTPVGPHHFLAAKHIGGSVGNKFYYGGEVFTTVGTVADAGSDLRLWEVSERFSSYAPLYSGTDEAGKGLVVFGRGLERGVAVTNTLTTGFGRNQTTSAMTNGWRWGSNTGIQRWGTNKVSSVTTIGSYPMLKVDWDADSADEECMLADKDSSGGVFIQDNGVWKLAGMNYTIGPASTYSFNSDGSASFSAAILDFTGDSPLYIYNGGSWVDTDSFGITESSFYSSRISSRYSWITNNVTDFDQDVDLLPDWWELTYTNSATAMSPSQDSDGDTFSNLQEYIADTNPTNAESLFEIDGFLASTNETVSFTGSTARKYQLLYTTNDLADPGLAWITNGTPIWGVGTNTQITVTNTEDAVFYRMQVILP